MNETARSEAIKELEKFKKQYIKLLEKFPNISVYQDIRDNLMIIHRDMTTEYPKFYLPHYHNE